MVSAFHEAGNSLLSKHEGFYLFMVTRILIIILGTLLIYCPVWAAKIYKWEDKFGAIHISSQPPKNRRINYQTIISVPVTADEISIVSSKSQAAPISAGPKKAPRVKRNLPNKNIIVSGTTKSVIEKVIIGSWTLKYEGGGSELIYAQNGKFQYKNKNKRATFSHKGKWRVYQKRNRWYVSHKGKYFTKTRYGKTFSGPINDLYIVKKLSGKKLVLLEAKHRKNINNSEYDLGYFR